MNNKTEHTAEKIRRLALKIQGMAYFTELQGLAESPPENSDEVFYGTSLILNEISQELKKISNLLERTD